MGFGNKSYMTVWEVKDNKYLKGVKDVKLSSSRKDKQTGEYHTDFSHYVQFFGDAAKKAADLKERDRIQIISSTVETSYRKEENVTYYNFKVFDFEKQTRSSNNQQAAVDTGHTGDTNDADFSPF